MIAITIVLAGAVVVGIIRGLPVPLPKVVSASEILPMPAPLEIAYDGTFPCRGSGRIGWEHRYLVVAGDDGKPDGALVEHLRSVGFSLQESSGSDWSTQWGARGDVNLRMAPLSRWREDPRPVTAGPSSSEVEWAVQGRDEPLALVGLEPVGTACEV